MGWLFPHLSGTGPAHNHVEKGQLIWKIVKEILVRKLNIIMHFFKGVLGFLSFFCIFGFLYLEIKLNIISLNHKLVRCPRLERDWSSGDHIPIPGWVTPQIFIHTVTVVSGSHTQQQTSLTSAAGMVYTFNFPLC